MNYELFIIAQLIIHIHFSEKNVCICASLKISQLDAYTTKKRNCMYCTDKPCTQKIPKVYASNPLKINPI